MPMYFRKHSSLTKKSSNKFCCLISLVVSCNLMTTFVPDPQSQEEAFLGQHALIKFICHGPFLKIQIKCF